MTDEPDDALPDADLDAAEFVLATLPPDQARALQDRATRDPVLAASIAAWQERLAPLADLAPPTSAPAAAWRRLERALWPQSVGVRARIWQAILANFGPGFVGAACGMAVMALIVAPKMLISQPAVAALQAEGTPMPAYLVMVTKDGYATVIANNVLAVPDRSFELWGLPEGATVPVSLGVLPTVGRIKMPAIVPVGTTLLVSSEPLGGSQSGAPTGPVLFKGRMLRG